MCELKVAVYIKQLLGAVGLALQRTCHITCHITHSLLEMLLAAWSGTEHRSPALCIAHMIGKADATCDGKL